MKKHILVNNKKEIFERSQHIQIEFKLKGEYAWKWLDLFQACEYDEQTGILGVNYVAYGIATTRQFLNSPAVPFIDVLTSKENLEIQQDLQKRLCVSEMKRLIRANQEIRFHNTEYGIEGAGKNIREAIETFINDSVESFVEDDIDPRGDKEEYREIYFYNMENCEVYLPKKYVDKIWDEIENRLGENVEIDEATKAEKLREMNEGR
jgi:hypothetical protein